MFKYLLLFVLFSNSAFAEKCIKDIFNVGVGFDSAVFKGKRSNKKLELVSSGGLSVNLDWIIFCTDSKIEYRPYIYSRSYSFKNEGELDGAPNSIESLSLGVVTSKNITLFGNTYNLSMDIGQREDFTIIETFDDVAPGELNNIYGALGISSSIYRKKRLDLSIGGNLGLLIPDNGGIELGSLVRLESRAFYKLTKKSSAVLNLFFEYYSQRNKDSDTEVSRQELGLRGSYLFRF